MKVRNAIVSGLYSHAAKKDPQGVYRTLIDSLQVFIHPSSGTVSHTTGMGNLP